MSITRTSEKPEMQLTVIRPEKGWSALNLSDLWRYRELVYFMTWRDLKVRYKQTLLGASWAILRPFLTMVVFSIFFGDLAKVPSDGIPYPIFAFTALLPWELFVTALSHASRSLVQNTHMVTKVYFPRMILPIASIFAGLVDFLVAFVVLIGMMVFYKITPTANIWTLPLFLLLALITALGVGLWLSALNVLVPRCELYHAVPDPVLAFYYPDRLSGQYDPGKMASGICPQSHVWGCGWFSLGTAG